MSTTLIKRDSEDYVKGWNAAMSHAENALVALAYRAGSTKDGGTNMALFGQKLLLSAADYVGRGRKPAGRTHG